MLGLSTAIGRMGAAHGRIAGRPARNRPALHARHVDPIERTILDEALQSVAGCGLLSATGSDTRAELQQEGEGR